MIYRTLATFSVCALDTGSRSSSHSWRGADWKTSLIVAGRRISADDVGVHPWAYTDPMSGNPWRARSVKNNQSHRVVAFPMWLYCDDTSGNMSKKWNKHNSWLFTAAGLPREMAQQEANVHFLSTSNTAPPLEMLHGLVGQLEYVLRVQS